MNPGRRVDSDGPSRTPGPCQPLSTCPWKPPARACSGHVCSAPPLRAVQSLWGRQGQVTPPGPQGRALSTHMQPGDRLYAKGSSGPVHDEGHGCNRARAHEEGSWPKGDMSPPMPKGGWTNEGTGARGHPGLCSVGDLSPPSPQEKACATLSGPYSPLTSQTGCRSPQPHVSLGPNSGDSEALGSWVPAPLHRILRAAVASQGTALQQGHQGELARG